MSDRIADALRDQSKEPSRRIAESNKRLREIISRALSEVNLIRAQFSVGDDLDAALNTLARKLTLIEVMEIHTKGGATFYSALSEGHDFTKLPDVAQVKVLYMSEEEYSQIPATQESHDLFNAAQRFQ